MIDHCQEHHSESRRDFRKKCAAVHNGLPATVPRKFPLFPTLSNRIRGKMFSVLLVAPLLITRFAFAAPIEINIMEYNVDPTGLSPSTGPIQFVLNILSQGGKIVFPCGIYLLDAPLNQNLVAGAHMEIAGGGLDCTKIVQATGGANAFNFNLASPSAGVTVHDLTLTTRGSGGYAIAMNGSGNAVASGNSNNSFANLIIRGDDYLSTNNNFWAVGLWLFNVSQTQVSNVTIFGSQGVQGIGVQMGGANGQAESYVLNVSNSYFALGYAGLYFNDYWQGAAISNTNFGGLNGIVQTPLATQNDPLDSPAQLQVVNSQFNCAQYAIYLQSDVMDTAISNSLFILGNANAYGYAAIAQQTGFQFYGNHINGQGNNGYGVVFTDSATGPYSSGHIYHNTFNAVQSGIVAGAGVYNLAIDKNICSGGVPYCYSVAGNSPSVIIDDTATIRNVNSLAPSTAAIEGSTAIVNDAQNPVPGTPVAGGGTELAWVWATKGVWMVK